MISETSKQLMIELDQSIGELWAHHATLADATDDFLHVIIANGIFSTKIDGFSHAAHMTTPYILGVHAGARHGAEPACDDAVDRVDQLSH
jgi:hypothetical protein